MLAVLTKSGDLGKAELEELCKAYSKKLEFLGPLGICDARDFVERLAFSKYAGEIIWTGTVDELGREGTIAEMDNFSVEVVKVNSKLNSLEVKRLVGEKVSGRPRLSNPEEMILVFAVGDKLVITRKVWEFKMDSLAPRDPQRRPVFHPTSLKPRFARLLVNLSGLKPGQTLLDPFCGVGGILIEAGLLGIEATGIEVNRRWASGAEENLNYYKVKAKVINTDFLEWHDGKFDAIVTDLPYGRSSSIHGNANFYREAIAKFREHSNKAVIMSHIDLEPALEKSGWKLERKLIIPIHKSLTRYIHLATR